MKKWRWWILGALVVASFAVAVHFEWPASAIPVETATVARGKISVTVNEQGRTRVRDRYVVAAPIAGRVERIAVREGRRVEGGDILARIYPPPADTRTVGVSREQVAAADARRLDAAAKVQVARAQKEQADRDLKRTLELSEAGVASRDAVEKARLTATSAGRELESKQAALKAAEADVAAARAALIGSVPDTSAGSAVDLRAPSAGRVLRVLQQSARVVEAGTPLIEIGSASGLEAVVDVLSEDAVQIKPEDPVQIDQWGGEAVLQGKVRLVEPDAFTKVSALGVEEQRVNVIVDLLNPPASLGVGYRLEAHIVTWTGENVLTVPTSALFQREGKWEVFTARDGRASRQALHIGHRSTDAVEILDGLAEGDRVILYPSDLVEDGVRVR